LSRTDPALRGWEYDYIQAALKDAKDSGVLSSFPRRTLLTSDASYGPMCGFASGSDVVLPYEDGVARLMSIYAQKKEGIVKLARSSAAGPALTFAACAANGKWIATSNREGMVALRDADLNEVGLIQVGDGTVKSLAISPSGEQIASETCGGDVVLWNAASGERIATIGKAYTFGRSIAFTPDGAKVALGGDVDTIELFDAKTGAPAGKIGPHDSYAMSMAFSPDGKWMAAGAAGNLSKSISIFEMATGRRVLRIDDHGAYINSLAFSPDSSRLLSASCDGTLRLWHMPSGAELLRLNVGGPCGDAQFIDKGKAIVWSSRIGLEVVSTR
jgi:WD40 repeat protein